MGVCLRLRVGALVAVFASVAGPSFAQYASPPAPPPASKPPASVDLPAPYYYGTPPFNPVSQNPDPSAGKLPPPGDLQPPPPQPPPPPPPPHIADLTPPEFSGRPATTVCDGCRACDNPAAWLFSAEYLLVRPRRQDDDFGIVDPANNLTPVGNVKDIGFDLASGIRAGIGYRAAGSAWESWFTYTYLHAGGDASAVAPPGGIIYATLTRPGLVDDVLVAAAGDNLTYNVYDFDQVRRVLGDDTFNVRLGFGARYVTIDQNQTAFYNGMDANGTQVTNRVSFDGGGLTASGEARWQMPWGLSVFGRAKGGLIIGDVRNTLRETDNGGTTLNANITEHYYATVPVLEMGTGVAWEYHNLRLSAGYEITNWFNLIDSPTFTNDFAEGKIGRRQSDLSLEGLFVQLGIAY